ncbi:MAG: right-handed parallel beta-helix repeat-containing protein [Candidatus Thorarchaeota archaeon]|nr:right-handed parallel beta-helix repeat-containing protein [Candidatus Thorarchaeota archaeon]
MTKRLAYILLIGCLLSTSLVAIQTPMKLKYTHITADYTGHDPLSIQSDADLLSQGWPGNGTPSNPYIIEGLAINTVLMCINIENVRAYVVIRNCLLTGQTEASTTAIRMKNASNIHVESIQIYNMRIGALVFQSANITIVENYVMASFAGISLIDCEDSQVENNIVEGNPSLGIGLSNSQNCTAKNNTVTGLAAGLGIYDSSACNVSYNLLFGCSLNIRPKDGGSPNTFNANQVNGKPLKVLENKEQIHLQAEDFGQIVLLSCKAVEISGGSMRDTSEAILIIRSTAVLIHDIVIRNCSTAIDIRESENTTISKLQVFESDVGVLLGASYNSTITNCTMDIINSVGVYNAGGANTTIINTTIHSPVSSGIEISAVNGGLIDDTRIANGSYNGISISSSTNFTVTNNIITDHGKSGIALSYSYDITMAKNQLLRNMDGIAISYCHDLGLENNEIINSRDNGVQVMDSYGIIMSNNLLLNSSGYGILLDNLTRQCILRDNTIALNRAGDGLDNGHNNIWSHNAWSDYNGTGNYHIPGQAGEMDQLAQTSDIDGDDLSDWAERFVYGSNPFLNDTDHDGLSDGEEVARGLNPTDPYDAAIAQGDYSSVIIFSSAIVAIVILFVISRRKPPMAQNNRETMMTDTHTESSH